MDISYSMMVPSELQEECLAIRDQLTASTWRLGDICGEVRGYCMANQMDQVGWMEVYYAVAMFSGKSARTIREYKAIADFYPPEIREAYAILSYDHFRHAATLGSYWHKALDWCVSQVETLGRPAGVDAMVEHFIGVDKTEVVDEEADEEQKPVHTILDMLERELGGALKTITSHRDELGETAGVLELVELVSRAVRALLDLRRVLS